MSERLKNFIVKSKNLIDFTRCCTIATNYKKDGFNFLEYSLLLQQVEKEHEMGERSLLKCVIEEIVVESNNKENVKDAIISVVGMLSKNEIDKLWEEIENDKESL